MDIFVVSIISIIISILSVIFKKENKEISTSLYLVGTILLFAYLFKYLSPILEQIKDLSESAGIKSDILAIMLKAGGIGLISSFSSQICADLGENALSMHIQTTAKLIVLLLSMPLLKTVINELFKFSEV